MISRIVTIAAAVLYLSVTVGCLINPPEPAAGAPRGGSAAKGGGSPRPIRHDIRQAQLPFRGAAIQLQRVDWMETEYRKCVDDLAEIGLDTVLLSVNGYMENGTSSRIYIDLRATPTRQQLGDLIDYAKGKKLRVILMPVVLLEDPQGNEWRGAIKPKDWSIWWDSYRQMLRYYTGAAEDHKVDVFVIGSELVSTEEDTVQWNKTIEMMRGEFTGMLTYSANWDHYASVPFWDQLDLFSTNSYYKLGENRHVTVEEIQRRWTDIQASIFSFQKKIDRPFIFTEVGWCSVANAADEPWDYTQDSVPLDLELQRKLYEGFFRAWHGQSQCGGFTIWEWPGKESGTDNRGYTPKGKPAEKVLREWIAKPRWEVK